MKIKKLLPVALSVVLLGTVGVGATLAYFTDTAEKTNVVTMGHVDIDLKDTEITIKNMVPGQPLKDINNAVTLGENSRDAYVRVRIDVDGDTKNPENTIFAVFKAELENNGWKYVEEKNENGNVEHYFYYSEKLTKGSITPLFDYDDKEKEDDYKMAIPVKWDNTMADKEIKVSVHAEAIQADYFEPKKDGNIIISWDIDSEDIKIKKYEGSNATTETPVGE
ncbi:MAG: SipW-dependent-type signal peptide-containing protein [Lachnospiraceae bacterium]|nr:SipW-dependent-type signal peptide-containing protein [Lachnospiraceae bacterium]